jgi:hypothetical protein
MDVCPICYQPIKDNESRVLHWPEGMPFPKPAHRACTETPSEGTERG